MQFLKNNSVVIIERVSMDGERVRSRIHEDREIDDVTSLHMHYMRETGKLYLLDRQTNKIRYLLDEKSGYYFRRITPADLRTKVIPLLSCIVYPVRLPSHRS